jgi:hypothetical protein
LTPTCREWNPERVQRIEQEVDMPSQAASPKGKRNTAPFRKKPQTNSKTGINGVSITYTMGNNGRTKMPVVNVHYKLAGKEHNRRFYIHLYTSLRACLKDAVLFRKKMEKAMAAERKHADMPRKRRSSA